MKLKDGYKKLIGTSYNGDISLILLSNGGNLGYDISSTANTLVLRNANGLIESSLATGTAPLKVASTTLVENLNADLLDELEGSFYKNRYTYNVAKGKYLKIVAADTSQLIISGSMTLGLAALLCYYSVYGTGTSQRTRFRYIYYRSDYKVFVNNQSGKRELYIYNNASSDLVANINISALNTNTPYCEVVDALPTSYVEYDSSYALARLSSNVASATKLQTARTIWGQSFDGTADVSGDLTLRSSTTSGDTPKIIFQRGATSDSYYDSYIYNTGGSLTFGISTGGTNYDRIRVALNDLRPVTDNSYALGTTTYRYSNIYSILGTFSGNVTIGGTLSVASDTTIATKLTLNGIPIYKNQDGMLYIDGNLAVNGSALATSFVTSGGTASLFVKGDGSLDDKAYITATDIVNTATNGIFYIEGTGTTAGTWLGEHASISLYYKGLTIAYKIPIAGASTTTININSLGAKTIRRNDSALTTHLPVNSVVILVYDGTYFRWADYDANSYAYVRLYLTDTTAAEYPLLFRYDTNAPSSYVTQYTRYDSAITVNPSTNTITAALFNGPAASVSNKLTLKVNGGTTEGTNLYTYNGSAAKTLDIKAGNNITLTATAGILTIASSYTNTTYTLSGLLSGNTFVTTLTPSSGTPTTATVPAMTAATSSAAGKAGLVPAPAKGQQAYFLRGDGTWVVPTNTWRNIKVNGTQIAGTGTGTYSVDYLSGDGISVTGVAGTSTTKNNTITITNTGVRSVTIGTGDNANKVAVNTGGTTTYLTIPYATHSTHLIGGALGSIPYQSAADTTTFLAAPTTNGYVLKYNTTDKKPYWAVDSDTKNTAGSTNSTSKLFLIGATSLAANPLTYSNSAVFATNGTLNATNFVSGTGVSDFSAGTVKLDTLNIPTASGGTTFGPGTSGLVLKSNGTTVYWASDSNSDTKVTQTITTTNADYRVLFSATADNTTRTEAARKASNLLFNPSSGLLTAGGFVKSGSSDSYVLLGGGGHKALSELGGVSGNYVLKTGDTMTGNLLFVGGDDGRFIVIDKAGASIYHYATTTSGWAMGSYIKDNAGNGLGTIAGAYGTTNTLTYFYYGGNWDNPSLVILPNKNVGINITTPAHTLDVNGNVLVRGQIINNSDPGPDGVGVPGAGVYEYSPNMANWLPSHKSFIGSAYNTSSSTWWNLISVRHRNGYGDGNKYGMYICASLTTNNSDLCWNKLNNGNWIGERTLLDNSNWTSLIGGSVFREYYHWPGGNLANFGDDNHSNGIFYINASDSNTIKGAPFDYGSVLNLSCGASSVLIAFRESYNYAYLRTRWWSGNGYGWAGWNRIVTQSFDSSITATAFYSSSDINLKTNILVITNSNNIPELKEFDWKKDGSHSYGLIAQELEEMGYSELVELNGEYKTVNYSAALSLIVGKLLVKIKELEKEIETLKNKN